MPTSLLLTSRSAIETGFRCPMERYLEYHSNDGFGIVRSAMSLPLVTGTYIHQALDAMLGGADPETSIKKASSEYITLCESRGYLDEPGSLVKEQSGLLEGLCWAWAIEGLPRVLDAFEILAIESEVIVVVDCDCGLGDLIGTSEEHEAKGCHGIGIMVKPDFVARRKSDGSLGVHDFKSASKNETDKWSMNMQMALQTLAAERLIGENCSHYYIHNLVKGYRFKDDKDGIYKQNSPLCWAYRRPGAPPATTEDWKTEWRYTDAGGKGHTLQGKGYYKAPVWEHWNMREWVERFSTEERLEMLPIVGPLERPSFMIESLLRDIIEEERAWQQKLYDIQETPELLENLHLRIRRHWTCQRYKRYTCPYVPICWKHPGWEKPLEMVREDGQALFVRRRPHHEPERELMRECGLEVPEESGEAEDDE